MGGVETGENAAELMLAGAAAVAVGTASFIQPAAAGSVLDGLAAYCAAAGVKRVRDLTGGVRLPSRPAPGQEMSA
jgi:dihydroorotate dehydrogenase (NAD+) catalytic subunit